MFQGAIETYRTPALVRSKCLHNQFVPISRLPVELLSAIFQDVATNRSYFDKGNPKYHQYLNWIPEITQVCYLWREVALQTASLWSRVYATASPSWALEFINRSKNAPIHLTTTYCNDHGDRRSVINECTSDLLQRTAKRIETIEIDGIHFSCIPSLLSLISSEEGKELACPLLRELQIAVVSERQRVDFLFNDDNLRTPALQKLSLSGCSVAWNAVGLLRNLSHLYVVDVDFSLFANIDVIFDALSLMPTLARLALESRNGGYPVFAPATRLASLPSLRIITLKAPSQAWLVSFLQNISHDRARDVNIHLLEESTPQKLGFLFDCFMRHVHASRILSVRITYHFISISSLLYRDSEPWQCHPFHLQDPSEFHTPHTYALSRQSLLEGLFQSTQLLNLQELRICSHDIVSLKKFADIFGNLPHLHTVGTFKGELDLVAALVKGIETSSPDPGFANTMVHIPFRALQSLIIIDRSTPYSSEDGRFILQCLKKRQEFKLPLKRLEFYFIYLRFSDGLPSDAYGLDLDALRAVVESVIVHEF